MMLSPLVDRCQHSDNPGSILVVEIESEPHQPCRAAPYAISGACLVGRQILVQVGSNQKEKGVDKKHLIHSSL